MNPYLDYYSNQAQTGAGFYSGTRYNLRGRGIFSSLFAKALPALKWLGRHALKTGINIAGDALEGQNVLKSAKSRLTNTGYEMANEGLDRAKSFVQTGTGKMAIMGPNLKTQKRMSVSKQAKSKSPKKIRYNTVKLPRRTVENNSLF